jgi:hydroxymethylpyrimidine pyrophosphatase-like HAD family hydrolase
MTALGLVEKELPAAGADGANTDISRQIVNLLDDLDGLAARLHDSLAAGDWLDSFLLVAAMNQITEDYLHRDVLILTKVTPNLRRLPSPVGTIAALGSEAARRTGLALRDAAPAERSIRSWQGRLAQMTQALADRVANASSLTPDDVLETSLSTLLVELGRLPTSLRKSIVRLPTCFQSLDQRPDDYATLAARFIDRWPERKRAVRVLGLRTSGSYLAPLVVAYLRKAGYLDIEQWTLRPGQPLHRDERERFASFLESDALLVVVDDPPKTGTALVRAVHWLEHRGCSRDRLVMLVPLTGAESSLPGRLLDYQSIALPWPEWSIHAQLEPKAVRLTLQELLVGREVTATGPRGEGRRTRVKAVTEVRRLPDPPIADLKAGSPVRRHLRAIFDVCLEGNDGEEIHHRVYAKGVGLGYFGQHSLTVATSLARFVPETYGLRDGLLFRAWIPETARIRPSESVPGMVDRVADYVLARRAHLGLASDVSERLVGMMPVWQRVAGILAKPFGHGRAYIRPLSHAAALRLLKVSQPSIIDGSMAVSQWFRDPWAPYGLLKVDYDERAYSNQDTVVDQIYSFDAAFDLAAAAADLQLTSGDRDGNSMAARLRVRFESEAGPISAEKWLLYQLVALKSYAHFLESMRSEVEKGAFPDLAPETLALLQGGRLADEVDRVVRLMSRLDQNYLGELFLADIKPSDDGALCAIDIDGVLETGSLGYSSVTPLGALALRSLKAHGYRPILVTGRSAEEVRDKCNSFGLAGGVGEYGAALYNSHTDQIHELLSAADRDDLDRLRSALSHFENVCVASRYRRAVRASVMSDGKLMPLPDATVRDALEACGLTGRVRAIHGLAQTDFMVTTVDKATGLKALLERLNPLREPSLEPPLAFAIGDTVEDVPMLEMAKIRVAPANADAGVEATSAIRMSGQSQSGLAEGIRLLIGHVPGRCAECRPPALSRDADIVVTAFGAQQDRKVGKLWRTARLTMKVVGR